jgi:hypothetical protein
VPKLGAVISSCDSCNSTPCCDSCMLDIFSYKKGESLGFRFRDPSLLSKVLFDVWLVQVVENDSADCDADY